MSKIQYNIVIKFLSVFTITMSLVGIVIFIRLLNLNLKNLNSLAIVVIVLVIYLMIMLIYTNICILVNKNMIVFSYRFNIIINFLQIIHLQLFGFVFHFIATSVVSPYIIYNGDLILKIETNVFAGSLKLLYSSDLDSFFLGINLVSFIAYYIYRKSYKFYLQSINSKSENEKVLSTEL